MPKTTLTTEDIRDQEITRDDLNTTTPGKAVVYQIRAGDNIVLSSTGADEGTGRVTVNVSSEPEFSSIFVTQNINAGGNDGQTTSVNLMDKNGDMIELRFVNGILVEVAQ